MKKIILASFLLYVGLSSAHAVKLNEFLKVNPTGKLIGKWKASKFVPEHLVGKLFGLPSERGKMWQMRFFTFEDRQNVLGKNNSFSEFVKKFGLEDLESKADSMPYNEGTFQSFTHMEANEFLKARGKSPLPEDIYFIISFRDVS